MVSSGGGIMTIYTHLLNEKNIKIKIKKLELLKNHYKQMANILSSNEVITLLEKWQGKKYNKRLETALHNIDTHFYVDTRFSFYLEYNFYPMDERSFKDEETGHTIYIDNYKHSIRMLTKSSWGEDEKIIADNIAEQVLNVAKYYQTQYEKINNQLFGINELLNEYFEIVKRYNEFEEKVDADIRAEFGLNLTQR
jgi:hypothetical protein